MDQDYALLVDRTELKVVKWYLGSPESDIEVVILLAECEDLAEVPRKLDCEPEECRQRALALARRGAIRFAVKELADVRPPWAAYAVSLGDLDDALACRVIYVAPAYFVQLER